MNENRLKCPFCGSGEVASELSEDSGVVMYHARCYRCGAIGPDEVAANNAVSFFCSPEFLGVVEAKKKRINYNVTMAVAPKTCDGCRFYDAADPLTTCCVDPLPIDRRGRRTACHRAQPKEPA